MSRLVIQSGPECGREIALRPGLNRLGRHADNDVEIRDESVSGHHCEITPDTGGLRVVDLGSTNGTFVEGEPIQEAVMRPGQKLQVGAVELLFEPGVQVHAQPPVAAAPALPAGMSPCKNHPHHPAEWLCQRCHQLFCVVCAIPRTISGKSLHFCTACGGQCVPYGLGSMFKPKEQKTFFSQLPEFFSYPLRGSGFAIILAGAVASAIVGGLRAWVGLLVRSSPLGLPAWFLFHVIVTPIYLAYFFSYLEDVVRSSAQGDDALPSWPEFSDWSQDIVRPLVHAIALFLVCFGPAWFLGLDALLEMAINPGQAVPIGKLVAIVGLAVCGVVYFPMAALAVAMADSVAGLNPLVVIPSILRVPVQYLVTCSVMLAACVIIVAGMMGRRFVPIPVLPSLVTSCFGFYLLIVQMRVLGVLYLTNKDRLKWF